MRLAPLLAAAAALVLVVGAAGALSDDEPTPPTNPPRINLWRRTGKWTVTMSPKAPLLFDEMYIEQPDAAPSPGGEPAPVGVVDATPGIHDQPGAEATPLGVPFRGICAGSGKTIRGTFDPNGGDLGKFAIAMKDSDDYERFTGKYFALGTQGTAFTGTYQRPPVEQEEGVANLDFRLYVIKAAHNLSLSGLAKRQVTSILRDKGAKLAILGMAVNTGPDLLPNGVGRLEFVVSPAGSSFGVAIPYVWKLDRVVEPVHYRPGDLTNTSWLQYATMGAFGQPKDRAVFAFEIDVPAGLPAEIKAIHVRMGVESNAPGFDLSGSRDAVTGTVQAEAVIAVDDAKPL